MIDRARIEAAFISHHRSVVVPTTASGPNPSLLDALSLHFPHIPTGSWPDRLRWGGVFVNGRPVSEDAPLPHPCKVEYYEPKYEPSEAALFFPSFEAGRVVYEDDDLIAYAKPAGLPCLPAREQTHFNLRTYLERHTGQQVHMPSRLDMSTSGIVIASKSARMHKPLQQIFEGRRIEKLYALRVSGAPVWERYDVDLGIAKHPEHPVLRAGVSEGGASAHTRFRVVGRESGASVWIARPLTGRTHQIRVHAAALGHPICGDNFYGGAREDGLRLLAFRLRFVHPFDPDRPVDLLLPREFVPTWADPALLFPDDGDAGTLG